MVTWGVHGLPQLAAALLAALFGATIGIVGWTGDLETVGIGLLGGLLLLPSIVAYAVFRRPGRSPWAAQAAFVGPWLALIGWFVVGAWLDAQREVSDGSGDMAALLAVVVLLAGVSAYAALRWYDRVPAAPPGDG